MGRRRRRVDRKDSAGALPEAIAALSRTLPAGPSPETFRRAKFDLPEAAPALWRLLVCMLSQLRAGGNTASPAAEAQARWVKSELLSQGYPRWRRLTQLPEDGSRGSRELLLALSWLLARETLPERLLAQTRVQLGDNMPVCECDILASPGLPEPRAEADGPVDVRHLQWLMGKLRFRWRTLMASQQEQCALLGKIHWYTRGCHSDRSLGHLSVAETELLRDPESGRQLLRRLESENARLEATLEWRRREVVFWPWMDTVLGACPPEAPQPMSVPRPRESGAEELERQLQALQAELREAVEARRAALEARVGGRGPEWSVTQQATQDAVGQELVALRWAWEQSGDLPRPHGPYRLVRTEAGMPEGLGLQAAEVIRALQSREACLEETLCQLQAQCQQQLARLAGALPGLIWIPPPGC
ncbi:tubulin epsilon and delta complex protein 1 isoform X1 [Desmodus rotundus]|uniref:tubulin epsilon and delta complex protein 1 isoform X1 n=1 Tax=Desmodus rotundus TaxID=9430 RepID=UPI000D182C91|nr:tubulin epsilon and delta complex protein 1 isoform X1 [Desmodus rotundus]